MGQHLNPKKHCFSTIWNLQLLFRLTLKPLTKNYMQVCSRNTPHLHLTDKYPFGFDFFIDICTTEASTLNQENILQSSFQWLSYSFKLEEPIQY